MLFEKITADLKDSLKSGEAVRVSTLRFLLSALKNKEIEKRSSRLPKELTEAEVAEVIRKQVKTHQESIEAFRKGQREDLVRKEELELTLLESYLPRQMKEAEIMIAVKEIIDNKTISDFGAVMKEVMGSLKGKADGATVARVVKEMMAEKQ